MKVNRWATWFRMVVSVAFALAALPTETAHAGTIRYAKQGGATSGTCTSWSTACTLRRALSVVAVAGDQIWVAKGTHKPGSARTDTFQLKNGVAVYGGFAGTETSLSQRKPSVNVTILSGEIGAAGNADNSYHVATGSGTNSTAILDGFKIVGGNANGASFPGFHGGGMLNNFGSPTLKNLTFTANRADYYGGGMYNSNSSPKVDHVIFSGNTDTHYGAGMANGYNSSPTLTNLTFTNNTADHGGGMFNYADSDPVMTNVTFSSNHAGSGGGMENDASSAPKLTNVSFNYNTADPYGGGMANYNASSPILTNVRFSNNSATQVGGGMYNYTSSNPTLTNVTFSGNTSPGYYGGGMYNYKSSPTLSNVTFSQNKAFYGGGMYNYTGSPTLKNVTFSGNTASYSYGGAVYNRSTSTPKIYNAVLWGDITSEIYNDDAASVPVISNSIVAGGCPSGSTCISVLNSDPVLGPLQDNGGFTKTMALGMGSAAIDRGNNATCIAKDQRGVSRPQGGTCDMGAYEVKALSHRSVGAYDGWLLESGENTNVGGTKDATAITLRIGDDSANRQYISLMSFDTSDLPDGAALVKARVKVKQHSVTHLDVAAQPTINTLFMDLKKPFYGSLLALQLGDFQAAATVTPAGSIDPTLVSGWYGGVLNSAATAAVNKTGTTQLRLRFVFDDNNNNAADYLSVYSGNAGTVSYRPLLFVYFNP